MNEIKRNLKFFTLLAVLLAGNVAFAPEEMLENNPDWTEPSHEDPVEERARLKNEALEKERQQREQEEARKNESIIDKARRRINAALGRKPGTPTESTTSTGGLFSKPKPARRSTGEPDDSGTPLLTKEEAAAPEGDFHVVDRSEVPNSVRNLTQEEVEKLTPEDVNKFTQRDIVDLGTDVANLSLATFESLSKAQTVALKTDQITVILANPELASRLKIENLNPKELSQVFNFRNIGEKLPNEIVARFTKDQINTIFENNPANMNDYFTPDQIKEMRSRVSLKDQATRQLKRAADWLNSTTVGKWLNKIGNRGRDGREATRMARSKANGTFDSKQQEAFESHLEKLNTKEKEEVANAWADTRISKVRDIEKQLKTAETTRNNGPKITALRTQLTAEIQAMDNEMMAFRDELQSALPSNEVVIPLRRISTNQSDGKVFEIIDMNKIDPTKSIEAQYSDLKSSGFFGMKDPAVSYIKPGDLLNEYGSWVAKGLTIDPSEPVAQQLETETAKITGKKWSELDGSIKVAIFVRLGKEIQDRFTQDAEDKNTAGAARAKKEFQTVVLAMNPETIESLTADDFKDIDPETIANFSTEQVQALNFDQLEALSPEQYNALDFTKLRPDTFIELLPKLPTETIANFSIEQVRALNLDQIEALSPEQYNALDFTKLRSNTIAVMLSKMPAEKIATLTQEQLRALPEGRLRSALAKLSVADLKTIEAAFKSAGNPFEATVTREIARQEKADSYKGNFDVHRIAINNAETLNTRPENIGQLSLDVVRDLDAETANKMSDDQINAFTKEQLNVLGKDALNAITPRLAPTAIAELSPSEFSKIEAPVLADLTPKQAEVITKPQLEKLNVKQKDAAAKSIERYSMAKAEELGLDLNEPLKGKGRSGKRK